MTSFRHRISQLLDRVSDNITSWMGSTQSILFHSIILVATFGLIPLGFNPDSVLLVMTTILSIEAIFLAIFIQRAVNKQSVRLESAIEKIVKNVTENIEEPLDEVVAEIRETVLETQKTLATIVSTELDQAVLEVGAKVEQETNELAEELHPDQKNATRGNED